MPEPGHCCFLCGKPLKDPDDAVKFSIWLAHHDCFLPFEKADYPEQPHYNAAGERCCRRCCFGGVGSHKTCVCECHKSSFTREVQELNEKIVTGMGVPREFLYGNAPHDFVTIGEAECGDNPRTTVDSMTMGLRKGDFVRLQVKRKKP